MNITLVGEKKFMAKLTDRLSHAPIVHAKKAVLLSVDQVRNVAVNSIARGAKSGGVVKKYNPKRLHLQSGPLQPPATDTGFLVSQISSSVKVDGTVIVGEVKSSAPYSKFLEYGTRTMIKRPFMLPALRKSKKKIKEIFVREGLIGLKGKSK